MVRVGIDVVEVARLRGLVERRGTRALERLFTPRELERAAQAKAPRSWERLAARFAAKEAFVKALGRPVPFRELEVTFRGPKPYLTWRGRDYPLSLSHTRQLAVAVVMIEED